MKRHIIMNLEAPLMAFGGETVDNLGVIRRFPAASMLTGIFANALGWRRIEREKHQDLQDRLIFAARIEREPAGGLSMQDFQTAQLGRNDRGWTTRGVPEGRAGGANTYNAPHLRYRDYFADMRVTVALRLRDTADSDALTLDDLAHALREPKRPLFIGRKPCLPSTYLFVEFTHGDTALAALLNTTDDDSYSLAQAGIDPTEPTAGTAYAQFPRIRGDRQEGLRHIWPDAEGVEDITPNRSYMLTDERNWRSGLHGGGRLVHEGSVDKDRFGANDDAAQDCEKDGEA